MASRSLVALMPVEISRPASSPASLPALESEDTHTAVSSNRGSLMSWARAWMPTLPVPMAATLIAMASSSQVRDGQIEVGEGDAAVDLEGLAGQVAACGGGEIDGG